MQTIEEYKAYTKQLEGEVGKWHHAYDALVIERNQLVSRIKELEKRLSTTRKIIETCSSELETLRKHELQWELDKARIKELEACIKKHIENFA